MESELKPGDVIDGFRVVEALGRGNSGEAVLATDPSGRKVVLKLPFAAAVASTSSFDRFRREMAIAAKLDHPGIVRSVEHRADRSRPYVILEFVEGETLFDRIAREKRLDVDTATGFAAQLARAAAYAHAHGVVHRDIKPENVLVTPDGRAVLTDFGIALLDGARRLTWGMLGASLGTPGYMSPEQIRGKRGDARSDVFAIGATLFHMLSGQRPWTGDDAMSAVTSTLSSPPPTFAELGVEVPRSVEAIARRCLRKEPSERYQDADALARDLEHWREVEPAAFAFADEAALAPPGEHALLLALGIAGAFLLSSVLLVAGAYLVGHH